MNNIREEVTIMNLSNRYLFVVREWGKDLGFNLEIEKCLREFHGNDNVEVFIIPNNQNIVSFFVNLISIRKPKRIYMDTRIFIVDAALLSLTRHLTEVSVVNRLLKSSKVLPVCIQTDALKAPGHLMISELLVHGIGVLVPLGANSPIRGFSPNSRVHDSFNPISFETATFLKNLAMRKSKDLFLGGSLYEPRKSFINSVIDQLHASDIDIEVLPKKTNRYIDYLIELSKFRIVLNTNFVVNSDKKHMVGRNIETLHVGSLLLTQNTPRLEMLFTEGEHYINMESPADAATKIKYYLEHQEEANRIALAGQIKALSYARESYFLNSINRKIHELQQRKSA